MYFKKGKPYFQRKDLWDLPTCLGPVIAEAINQFKKLITDETSFTSVPNGVSDTKGLSFDTEEGFQEARDEWLGILDKMIYAFEDSAPDILGYNFEFVPGEGHGDVADKHGSIKWVMEPDNPERYNSYKEDCKIHQQKVREGLELFSKYYHSLWD